MENRIQVFLSTTSSMIRHMVSTESKSTVLGENEYLNENTYSVPVESNTVWYYSGCKSILRNFELLKILYNDEHGSAVIMGASRMFHTENGFLDTKTLYSTDEKLISTELCEISKTYTGFIMYYNEYLYYNDIKYHKDEIDKSLLFNLSINNVPDYICSALELFSTDDLGDLKYFHFNAARLNNIIQGTNHAGLI